MSRYEVSNEIAENTRINWRYYPTWEISVNVELSAKDDDPITTFLYKTTHNEEDKTGIFDGK